jgi:bacterial/archaeal transporter family-2 protein
MFWVYVLLAVAAGGVVALQAGINGQLRIVVGTPVQAAMVSAAITTGLLFVLAAGIMRSSWPSREAVIAAPWWVWSGGALGGIYLVAAVILVPRLGAGVLFALLIVGQVLFALLLDHFGIAGFPERGMSVMRVVGAVMVIGGAVLVQRG